LHSNPHSIYLENAVLFASDDGGRMSLDTTEGRYKEYMGRAEHCLKMAKVASNSDARVLQREWAAEWLKLAKAVRRPRRFKQMQMG